MPRLFNVIKEDGNVAAEADFAPHNRNDVEKPQV
jgi:hypothetical protein